MLTSLQQLLPLGQSDASGLRFKIVDHFVPRSHSFHFTVMLHSELCECKTSHLSTTLVDECECSSIRSLRGKEMHSHKFIELGGAPCVSPHTWTIYRRGFRKNLYALSWGNEPFV